MKAWTLAFALLATPAAAHDVWMTGEPVPDWVKKGCCGPKDVHHIPASAIHLLPDGYHIDGIKTVVKVRDAMPSADGQYWAFWNPDLEPYPGIYCFFAPLNGT